MRSADLPPPDPRMLAEPVDIVPKLPPSFHSLLKSSKWKDRKQVLDELSALLNATPRIKDAPELGEVARSLAVHVQGDANINCVMMAAICMEALARGMAKSFGRFREMVVGLMLERLKERKPTVTGVIGSALDAIFATVCHSKRSIFHAVNLSVTQTTLPDIIPDIVPALGSKNPQVKEGTLKFLARCLSSATTPIQSTQIKSLSELLATLLEDGHECARNEAAICMGTLIKMVGERPMNAIMDGLAEVRKAKVKEAGEKATVKSRLGVGGFAKAPVVPNTSGTVAQKKADASAASNLQDGTPPQPKPAAKPPAKVVSLFHLQVSRDSFNFVSS